MIHSLNLNEGGGIYGGSAMSKPEKHATVVLGIGGTGVACLKTLKKKIFTQLEPCNPGEAIPHYDMIRLLGIDTDDSDLQYDTVSDLDKDGGEFQSIRHNNLAGALDEQRPTGKATLRLRPDLNTWMNIDGLTPTISGFGAGGIRQMGRFMLFERIQDVYNSISNACSDAVQGAGAGGDVDIHVIAGVSGGTGSGCFIDVCYLARRVLSDLGMNGRVFGYFFLPDVVISKPSVRNDEAKKRLNRRNGYAAFVELDYLMEMEKNGDSIDIVYKPGTLSRYRTNRAPVDLCHLVSARTTEGDIMAGGFGYSLNVVADYIMAYLSEVEIPHGITAGDGDNGLTMEGHLSNVTGGVNSLRSTVGASRSYHILGASNAEVPMIQIGTYLAAGLYEKFELAGATRPNDAAVDEFARNVGLDHATITNLIGRNQPAQPNLEVVKPNMVPRQPMLPRDVYPDIMLKPLQDWENACAGKYEDNGKGLSAPLKSFAMGDRLQGTVVSYVTKIHQALLDMCLDQTARRGPQYAAELMHRSGRNLLSVVDGLIAENNNKLRTEEAQEDIRINAAETAKTEYAGGVFLKTPSQLLDIYKQRLCQLLAHRAKIRQFQQINTVLYAIRQQLEQLDTDFYRPLSNLLESLSETFAANRNYLNSDSARQVNAYTWRVVQIDNPALRNHLDEVLAEIRAEDASHNLMSWLLQVDNIEKWRSGEDYRIGQVVNKFMTVTFSRELSRSIESYIADQYPGMQPEQIVRRIKQDIMGRADQMAEPMFWRDPSFELKTENIYSASRLNVPAASALLCQAATDYTENTSYTVRRTAVADRIFALRFYSGIPLYAYNGVRLLRTDYQQAVNASEPGLHLFERNTVLERKAEKTAEDLRTIARTSWGTYLPSPIPASKDDPNDPTIRDADKKLALYEYAEANGIIAQGTTGAWCVYESRVKLEEIGSTQRKNYCSDLGQFLPQMVQKRIGELNAMKDGMYNPANVIAHILPNEAEEHYETLVRKDFFVRFPLLIEVAEAEKQKIEALNAEIKNLQAMLEDPTAEQIKKYTQALCLDILNCKIGRIEYTHVVDYDEVIERLTNAEEALAAADYLYFKGYKGYMKLRDGVREEIEKQVKAKMDNLEEGDCALADKIWERVREQRATLKDRLQKLPMEKAEEVKNFYTVFLDSLRAFRDMFRM